MSERRGHTTSVVTPALDPFQYQTLDFLDAAHGRAVVADPMGARKTGTVLAWLDRAKVHSTLVVAPSAVHGHWAREAARFYPTASVARGAGTKPKRVAFLDGVAHGDGPVLYITTYESMKQDQRTIERAGFDCIVFDEGHKLKGRSTQVALCANSVTKDAPHVIVVTGTPVLNHASELWQYLHMLAPSEYRSFWRWVNERYVVKEEHFNGPWGHTTKVIHGFLPGYEEKVRAEIAPYFIQRSIEDLFPNEAWVRPAEHVEIEVELTAPERKVYKNLIDHKWALAGGNEVITTNGLDLTTRLTQITSDWGTLDDQLTIGAKGKAAVELTLDLLERDEQVVIFAKYKATVHRIVEALRTKGVLTVEYTGDSTADARDLAASSFEIGLYPVIVGTLDSLSEGVDGLQHAAANIIMVDRHWTPAKNDQAVGRLRRSGQERVVTVYHVFAKDTVDATITAACLRKQNVIETLKGARLSDVLYGRNL